MPNIYFEEIKEHVPGANKDIELKLKIGAVLRVLSLFGFMFVFGGILLIRTWGRPEGITDTKMTRSLGSVEYVSPYRNTLYENFGYVQDPRISLPLKTTNGYKDTTFLLDSGAVVSALPLQAAQLTGVDLAKAKRITLQGFTGVPTFAYLDQITIKIAEREFSFPAVFTESSRTSYILGRKGLFDDFTIEFDHTKRALILRTKE